MQRDINRLRRWCIKRKLEGWKVTEICEHARIPRPTFYVWWNKYQDDGWESLEPRSRRPLTIHRTPQETIDEVIRLRKQYNWGPNKIEGYIRQHRPAGIAPIGHNTIYRIISNAGLNNPIDKPRKTWGKRRFVRSKPNELWQADWKLTASDEWLLTYLDDYSRYIVGSDKFDEPTSCNAVWLLERCIAEYRAPVQLLTDQGTCFYPARGGISGFTRFCSSQGIEHIVASKRRPTTIGKIEAFHKAYEYEASRFGNHKEFIQYWNHTRPHQGIGYLYPVQLYLNGKSV